MSIWLTASMFHSAHCRIILDDLYCVELASFS